MSKRRGPKSISHPPKLVELPSVATSAQGVLNKTATFAPEPLPATIECANCDELRKLLAGMRTRVDELEYAYTQLAQERSALIERLTPSTTPPIEIVPDLPISNHA